MATLKDIRRRIRSVQSTQQITKAMEMVAAVKLRRAQHRSLSARPYAAKMTEILQNLASAAAGASHPLFDAREVRRRTLVVVASDKGLCGSFNANVLRAAEIDLRGCDRQHIDIIPVGRRVMTYFRKRGWTSSHRVAELGDQVDLVTAQVLARHIVDLYVRGETDRVDFVFTRSITTARRVVVKEVALPITPQEQRTQIAKDYIYEPTASVIFGELLPRYVQTRVMSALADSLASEHAARLISMTAATKNAGDMISSLTLIRNKLRQATITREISELVGGAEALR